MNKQLTVSVIIPVFNEEKSITECLSHIFRQTVKPYEVIVVDNNCTDKTIELARKFPVKVVKEKKQGIIHARNKGFNTATGAIIARTDADTLVPKDWIKRILKPFEDQHVVAAAGPIDYHDAPELLEIRKLPVTMFVQSFKSMFHHSCMLGPNMAIRRSTWKKIRSSVCMDDEIVHEDIDLSFHVSPYGEIAYDPEMVVNSSVRRWKKLKPYYEYSIRYLKTIKQHHESLVAYRTSTKLVKRIATNTKRIMDNLV